MGLRTPEHPAHGLAHEVGAGRLGHERQRARGPQVALDDPHPAVLDEQLKVERPRDGQRLGQLGGNLLGAMDDRQRHGLGRKHQGRITAVHAGVLHVLADGPQHDLAVVRNRIDLDLPGPGLELGDHHRVLGIHGPGALQDAVELGRIVRDAHRSA